MTPAFVITGAMKVSLQIIFLNKSNFSCDYCKVECLEKLAEISCWDIMVACLHHRNQRRGLVLAVSSCMD